VAAVVAAVGTLATVFNGGGEGENGPESGSVGAPQAATPAESAPPSDWGSAIIRAKSNA
jgi:hypothetical protein